MEFLALIDVLEEMVENAARVLFLINACLTGMICLILSGTPRKAAEDIKQAKWITEERQKILADAQRCKLYFKGSGKPFPRTC